MEILEILKMIALLVFIVFVLLYIVYLTIHMSNFINKEYNKEPEEEEEDLPVEEETKYDEITWKYFNNNPFKKSTGDCDIRAISKALNKTWEEVYEELYTLGCKTGVVFDHPSNIENYLSDHGFDKYKNNTVRGSNLPLLVERYYNLFKYKDVLLKSHKHMTFYKNGTVYDTTNTIYKYVDHFYVREDSNKIHILDTDDVWVDDLEYEEGKIEVGPDAELSQEKDLDDDTDSNR